MFGCSSALLAAVCSLVLLGSRVTPAPAVYGAPPEERPSRPPRRSAPPLILECFNSVAPARLPGRTPFQRRLAAGDRFRSVREEFQARWRAITGNAFADSWDLDFASAREVERLSREVLPLQRELRALLRHNLTVEPLDDFHFRSMRSVTLPQQPPSTSFSLLRLGFFLDLLAEYPIDLDSVLLATPSPSDDPLGRDLTIRVWIPATLADEAAELAHGVRSAARLVRRLAAIADVTIDDGFDVIVSPEVARDVIRRSAASRPVGGQYFPGDRVCGVASDMAREFRKHAMKHEVVHAFCHQFRRGLTKSAFVSEGLAEYLERLERWDVGLRVPPGRFADDFALLLHETGQRPDFSLDPPALFDLDRRAFYDLGSLGYRLAHATMAFVGHETIELAVRTGDPGTLHTAIRHIDPAEFVGFLERTTRRKR